MTDEPAPVFGNSSGWNRRCGISEQVRALIAHEPPLLGLLPDAVFAKAGGRAA
ncbi:hypothetical protein [Actinomadura sp. BRA 177]|uniref:hypothetical protein n=1 Tax=Actinomadura sp. BRA 177 TaxID=2745202 RepID=UPI001594E903|nr:hypothetical protein [Actinomadura sp. BRA 177]